MTTKDDEVWEPIPGTYRRYSASTHGRIRNDRTGRVLKPCVADYAGVSLSLTRGRQTSLKVHRLVARTFIGKRPRGKQVNHRDGNPLNNRPDNLEYVTCRENIAHAMRLGLARHGRSLTPDAVRAIRSSTDSFRELATAYRVNWDTIHRVKRGLTYRNIPDLIGA